MPNLGHPATTATAEAVGNPGIWPGDQWFAEILYTVGWRLWKKPAAVTVRVMQWEALQLPGIGMPRGMNSRCEVSECMDALRSLRPLTHRRQVSPNATPSGGRAPGPLDWRPFPVLSLSGWVG